jgi:hypothetical protein
MTLRELFQYATNNPVYLYYFFVGIPAICFLILILFQNPNNALKIKWVLSVLCFLAVVPGIFALTLNIYNFLFERQSILDINLFLQVLPIVSMALSLFLIKRVLPFDYIPGFEKLTQISTIIFGIMAIMWIIDRTHIMAFAFIPFSYIIIGFLALLILVRYVLPKLF